MGMGYRTFFPRLGTWELGDKVCIGSSAKVVRLFSRACAADGILGQ
jgi:hypothetical protein